MMIDSCVLWMAGVCAPKRGWRAKISLRLRSRPASFQEHHAAGLGVAADPEPGEVDARRQRAAARVTAIPSRALAAAGREAVHERSRAATRCIEHLELH